MLDERIKMYFDGIEPDSELIERTTLMLKDTDKKRMKFSKTMIALIAALVCILTVTAVSAAIVRVYNDKNNVVEIDDSESFVLNFENADRTPEMLSDTDNDIVKTMNAKGFKDVIIPSALITDGYRIDSEIDFIPHYLSAMYDLSNENGDKISMSVIQDIKDEDMNGFWGTGDPESIAEVINVNSMDVVVTIMGDDNIGYVGFAFYANGNTIYHFTYSSSGDAETVKQKTLAIVNSLGQ